MLNSPRIRLFAGAILISFSPVFVRLVDVAPTASAFYRVFIGGGILAAYLVITRTRPGLSRTAWIALIGAAIFFSLDLWFWHRSILYIGPGLSTLLANMQVFFMIAAGAFVLRQRPNTLEIFAATLAVVGIAMITGPQWGGSSAAYRLGVGLGILTAISYAGYMLALRRARLQSSHPVPVPEVAVVSLITAAMLGLAAVIEGTSLSIPTPTDGGWLLAYGVASHAVGWLLIAGSLTRVSTTVTGIALLFQPSLSFLWDILFFARPVTVLEGLGATIALTAIFIGTVRRDV
ncbi:MAG: DMT family transporter [Gammaproteobacteria bacterium]